MQKFFVFLRKPAEVDMGNFSKHYLEEHAQNVLRNHKVTHYAANIVEEVPKPLLETGLKENCPGIDSVDELWFEDEPEEIFLDIYRDSDSVFAAFQIDDVIIKERNPSWPLGTCSPMMKCLFAVNRNATLSREQFVDYWRKNHAPLALKHHTGMSYYVQNLITKALTENSPKWDGISELCYWNNDAFVYGHFGTPNARSAIPEDTSKFVARELAKTLLLSEYILR